MNTTIQQHIRRPLSVYAFCGRIIETPAAVDAAPVTECIACIQAQQKARERFATKYSESICRVGLRR